MANKSLQQLLYDFRRATGEMEALKNKLPRIIGVEAVRVVRQNFDIQGYDDGNSITKWPARAQATNDAYDYNRTNKFRTAGGNRSKAKNKYKGSVVNSGNPLLMQARNLYMAIQYYLSGRNVTIGVDLSIVPYAEKMNEGGYGSWGHNPKTWTPARQYVPKPNEPANPKITKAVAGKLEVEKARIMKEFKK